MFIISRDNIEKDTLQHWDIDSRLIKPDIGKYLGLMDISPNPPQNALINAANCPDYRFITACFSRRVGKTFIANVIGQLIALTPGSSMLIIAPDYSLSNISWDLQRELLREFDIETVRNNAKDRIIELVNGSLIKIASVAKADSALGRSYDLIIFDEAAINDDGKDAFDTVLRPTLDKTLSKCIFISTPRGNNWFKEFYDRGFDDNFPSWISMRCNWEENPRASAIDIAEAKATLSSSKFSQEYEASFVTFEGQVWDFSEDCVQDLTDIKNRVLEGDRDYLILAGLDIGYRDSTALCVIAHDLEQDLYYVIDEYQNKQKSTEFHALKINELMDKWYIEFIYIDSAAAQTRHDFASMYDIPTFNAKKDKLAGIGYVENLVEKDRIIIDPECSNTIHSMFNYKWNDKTITETTVHDEASHMADALRYAIYTHGSGVGGVG